MSYLEQLQTVPSICLIPKCISFGVDEIRYDGDGTAENAADVGYISNALLQANPSDWPNELGLGRGAIGASLRGTVDEANKVV